MSPLKHVRTDVLDVAYLETGPPDGPAAVLLHGYPYDVSRPPITVPTVTLEGEADGNFPVSAGLPDADVFTGPRLHRRVPAAGHNLTQEAPDAFVAAVLDVTRLAA
jgi:pimeloyl-ACP methyl ester carboxylesterase